MPAQQPCVLALEEHFETDKRRVVRQLRPWSPQRILADGAGADGELQGLLSSADAAPRTQSAASGQPASMFAGGSAALAQMRRRAASTLVVRRAAAAARRLCSPVAGAAAFADSCSTKPAAHQAAPRSLPAPRRDAPSAGKSGADHGRSKPTPPAALRHAQHMGPTKRDSGPDVQACTSLMAFYRGLAPEQRAPFLVQFASQLGVQGEGTPAPPLSVCAGPSPAGGRAVQEVR